MNYQDDLLNDFASDDESENEVDDVEVGEVVIEEAEEFIKNEQSLEDEIQSIVNSSISIQDHLQQLDIDKVSDISKHLKIFNIIPQLKQRLSTFDEETSDFLKLISNSDYDNDEFIFFQTANQLINIIDQEIECLFKFIRFKYSVVFPELDSIINNPIDYIKIIQIIKQDLINIKHYEDQFHFLNKDKILVLIMSGLQNVKKQFVLNDEDFNQILVNCGKVNELIEISDILSKFIQRKLADLTPNLNKLIGPITTSQLLISCGSLNQLCLTPSCNLPSLGIKQLSSKSKNLTSKNIQMGYIFDNDMIKYLPDNILKSSIRILSGKIILAARIDLSKSCNDGSIGEKFKIEVQEKINKLLTPPESKGDKALAIPSEYKSKKRGGRKIRKLKQKFQLSELAKAQNKVEFGKREDSVINQFGEEVGFGIIKNSSLKKFNINTNTNAKLSKALKSRLENNDNEKSKHLDSFEIETKPKSQSIDDEFGDIILKKSKWVNDTMKK
ncbi:pre-mRNA-processing factor 31 [[Candida] jaroonii]|uniref:Pre-mRNA-processing factor 31 n=1 Tax=[Candida] jaroonii TaxID=467808 RepID=A0ACA9Y5K6_9ASCO|nr:pre-mRNA-processing factor 31 [[Candida] jaroonii]